MKLISTYRLIYRYTFSKKETSFLTKIGLLFLLLFSLGQNAFSQQQYLKATLNSTITIEPESFIHLGKVTTDAIMLDQIPIGSDGYINFTFSGLTANDNIEVSLQNSNASIYYQMQFMDNEAILTDNVGTRFLLSTNARNNSLFKIKKCGNSVIWSDDSDIPILTATLPSDEAFFAKINLVTATNVSLDLAFDTSSENCEKCAAIGGNSLFPGDLIFVGYDNASGGNQIVLKNLTPISGGTSFSLMQGSYTSSSDRWYSTNNNGSIAVQKITYTGATVIPINSTFCVTLPTSGNGDALLANSFSVNGIATTDFCVENIGSTINPLINLSNSNASALFLVQGDWKLLDAHGEFSGRVLSGLQYGGSWRMNGDSPINGLSNIPTDIECMAIEDGLTPTIRYAYFTGSTPTVATITNFDNWQTGNGNLPSAVCGSTSLVIANQSRSINNSIRKNTAQLYPNPFKNTFTIQLDLAKPQKVKIDIYDSSGRIVRHQAFLEMDAGISQIPISFPNGISDVIFWTRIQLDEEIIVKRIVKQGLGLH